MDELFRDTEYCVLCRNIADEISRMFHLSRRKFQFEGKINTRDVIVSDQTYEEHNLRNNNTYAKKTELLSFVKFVL